MQKQPANLLESASTAADTDPGNVRSIVQELCQISLIQIGSLLDVFFGEVDNHLLRLAETEAKNYNQNKVFETKYLLVKMRKSIQQQYCDFVCTRFDQYTQPEKLPEKNANYPAFESLSLIELDEFEDWLTLEKIINRGNERYHHSLACLSNRYGKLIGHQISDENLPVSINNLCHALQEALSNYVITPELLPIIYRFYDEAVINQFGELYDNLNSTLKAHGILPNIESKVLRERKTITRPIISDTKRPNVEVDVAQKSIGDKPLSSNDVELYSTASNILSLVQSKAPKSELVPAADPVDQQTLLDALTALQHDQQTVDAIDAGETLHSLLQDTADIHLSEDMADRLKLISNLFQKIGDYSQVPGPLLAKLKRLEVPVAKTALLDDQFFATRPDHPAKSLLNQLLKICLNTDRSSRTLESKFDRVISDISNNFDQGSDVFQKALNDVSAIADHQHTAVNRNIERIAQIYDGRQRVQQAENAVEREIQRRVSPPEAPEIVVELIDNGWRDLLKLTYIKMGLDSKNWLEQLATLDQLIMWVSDSDEINSQSSFERELEADSFADLISQQLNTAFPGDCRGQETIEKIRSALKGHQEITMLSLKGHEYLKPRSPNELQKALDEAHPQLNRWFKRAKNLQVGDELSYMDDDNGQRNIKLVWSSDNKQDFVFVNNLGQKVLDCDLVDLANELSKGLSPVGKEPEWPLVEHSMYSTVQQAYEQLAFNSSHDELTGLLGRKGFERLLNKAIIDAKSSAPSRGLLYIDIDQFSLANNLHGHEAGDQLLIDVSKLLKDCTPESSVIARMAGNEFVVILQQLNIQDIHSVAEQLCAIIQNHVFSWQQHNLRFTISIGLMVINKYTENVAETLRNAVSASQTAKSSGGNRVYEFRQDAELHTRREKLLSWIEQLDRVLSSDRLVLRGQLISPLNAEENHTHYEILLAIRGSDGKLSPPIEFIEAAECYNRMQRIDRWVIENTFKWLNRLSSKNIPVPSVSINLSGNSLNDDQFMDFILEQFAHYKVHTGKVCFEVTETATINNLAETADFIREIKKIGCTFALDDFGSGNASYQYLRHLPVDYLKIDGMFVKEIDKSNDDYALVKSMNEIAHLMGKKTIAEYAESEAIIQQLKGIGVDYVQGYAIGKPTLLEQLPEISDAQETQLFAVQ